MLKTKWIKIIALAQLINVTTLAMAHDEGFFIGVETGVGLSNVNFTETNAAGRVSAGYHFSPYFGIEGGILGNLSDLYIIDGYVRGTIPFIDRSRIFAKLGVADVRITDFEHDFYTMAYGAGLGFDPNDYWNFEFSFQGYGTDQTAQFVSIGISYHLR